MPGVGPGLVCLAQLVLVIVNWGIVLRYFNSDSPDKRRFMFFKFEAPQYEMLGDLCLFLNMILAQAFWGYLLASLKQHRPFAAEFPLLKENLNLTRTEDLIALVLILYLPQRCIYLLADKHLKITWLTMLLANSPIIYRIWFLTH